MILGGEQPVALPTMSWYDKDAFKMYIAAVKDDYDKNIEEQKDFLDKYIDMAATDKDREYIANNVINPVVNFVNNNPNAIRSVEGRMMMRQLRNAINPEAISRIKGTAKIADPYNKIKAEMIANGTYSEDMQKAMGVDLSGWDSAKNGAFQQSAPYKLEHIEDLLLPTIKQLGNAYRYDEALTKSKHDGRRYSTVSDQQIYDSLNGDYLDLMQKPSMKYHLQTYLQNNPGKTESDFKNELFEQVKGQLGEKSEKDDLYFNNLQFRQQVALENLRHQHARQRAAEAANREETKNNNSNYPQLSSRLAYSSNEKFSQTSQPGANAGYFVNYFTGLAKTAKNSKDRNTYTRYANEWKQYNYKSKTEQIKFLQKYGYLDNSGQLTKKYQRYLADAAKTGGNANGYTVGKKGNLMTLTTGSQTANNALRFHQRNATSVSNPITMTAVENQYQKDKNGFFRFNFNGNGRMTVVDAMDVQGVKRSKNNIYDLANNWLTKNGVVGNIYDTSNVYQRTGGDNISLSNVGVTVNINKLEGLCNYLRKHGMVGYDRDILAKLGIQTVDGRGNPVVMERNITNYKGQTSTSSSSKQTGGVYGKIAVTFDVHGRDAVTELNNAYIRKNVSGNNTYKEFTNSFDSAEDVE